jgi:hypothetical protein
MNFYEHFLNRAAQATGVEITTLDERRAEKLRAGVESKFANRGSDPLWERLRDNIGKRRTDATTLACTYAATDPKILFFGVPRTKRMFSFPNGKLLQRLLDECEVSVFYITNSNSSYLLSQNDHEYLIGVGDCRAWLAELPENF